MRVAMTLSHYRVQISSDASGVHKLVIQRANMSHYGAYRCVARNYLGRDNSQAWLTVLSKAP